MNNPENYTIEKYGKIRTCGSCSECCKGYLDYGNIFEYKYAPKVPCHYLDECKHCTIHKDRPDVCRDYQCMWLFNPVMFPEWMKPNLSGVIISNRDIVLDENEPPLHYWLVIECGNKIRPEILNWILTNSHFLGINVQYQIDGVDYYIGDKRFNDYIMSDSFKQRQHT